MSKNAKGVLGQQVGKVGPVVARKFRNLDVYSAYQPNVKNPRTSKQQLNRLRFSTISSIAHGFGCAVRLGFGAAVRGTKESMRNRFTKLNIANVTPSGPGSVEIDYSAFVVAQGGLCPVHFDTSMSFDTPLTVEVTFNDLNANACQKTAKDKVYLVVYNPAANLAVIAEGVERSAGRVDVVVPSNWNGSKVQVYGFVRNDGEANTEFDIAAGECSDSTYIGSGTIG